MPGCVMKVNEHSFMPLSPSIPLQTINLPQIKLATRKTSSHSSEKSCCYARHAALRESMRHA